MKWTVSIKLSNTEGALERVLGRLRQRAFDISSMSAERSADRSYIEARFTIEGIRAPEPVIKQLAKLYEVQQLRFQYAEAGTINGQWQYPAATTVQASEFSLPV
jgi:acetolactate synthase regulatory subunit